MLNTDLAAVKGQLQENENANRVLQQTIKRRLPDLDTRLKAAKKALAELEQVNGELRTTVASQSDALKTARTTLHNQRSDIERLRMALETGGGGGMRGGKADARTLAESQRLTAELSKVAGTARARQDRRRGELAAPPRAEQARFADPYRGADARHDAGATAAHGRRGHPGLCRAQCDPASCKRRKRSARTRRSRSRPMSEMASDMSRRSKTPAAELDAMAEGMGHAGTETAEEPDDAAEPDAEGETEEAERLARQALRRPPGGAARAQIRRPAA